MCKETEELKTLSVSSSQSEDFNDSREPPLRKISSSELSVGELSEEECKNDWRNLAKSVASGAAVAAGMTAFALKFPFLLAPDAASKTYDWAYYSYDSQLSHFDNSAWTYGTDYLLAVIMASLAYSIIRYSRPRVSDRLCNRSASIFLLYFASVMAGGFCHQNYITLEHRNSLSFRILWTICVGTVTGASCSMGMSGSEVLRQFQQHPNCEPLLRKVPVIPDSFWWTLGLVITAVCALGGMSFHRPACDIFIAGITQTPSSFYLMISFFLVKHPKVQLSGKVIGFVGFIFNVPLLPMYPLLVQYTDWSLASVNTLLHCWLCVAWSMQGYSLRHMIQALVADRDEIEARIRVTKSQ
jgi:hypothetical protein